MTMESRTRQAATGAHRRVRERAAAAVRLHWHGVQAALRVAAAATCNQRAHHAERVLAPRVPGPAAGATACVALMSSQGQLCVASVGDSRCVLSDSGRALCLTRDHKAKDPAEARRIQKARRVAGQCGRQRQRQLALLAAVREPASGSAACVLHATAPPPPPTPPHPTPTPHTPPTPLQAGLAVVNNRVCTESSSLAMTRALGDTKCARVGHRARTRACVRCWGRAAVLSCRTHSPASQPCLLRGSMHTRSASCTRAGTSRRVCRRSSRRSRPCPTRRAPRWTCWRAVLLGRPRPRSWARQTSWCWPVSASGSGGLRSVLAGCCMRVQQVADTATRRAAAQATGCGTACPTSR
jgi:hypothetical protein